MAKNIEATAGLWIKLIVCSAIIMLNGCEALQGVNYTYLYDAAGEGIVCLDGGPSGYSFAEGSGDGRDNWMIFLEGGGWCGDLEFCSSKANETTMTRPAQHTSNFSDILDNDPTINPDFYNWNRVWVKYCDFGVFLGDIEDPSYPLPVRGLRIYNAVMDDLKKKGLMCAKNAMLVGGSAGGLATILHCDGFRALLPNANRLKCISESGFFQHAINIPGAEARHRIFSSVISFHNLTSHLPKSCTSKMNQSLCLFPEYLVPDVKTPMFFLESAFDQFQVSRLIKPDRPEDKATWDNCTINNLDLCTPSQLQIIKEFGLSVKATVQAVAGKSEANGIFIHSCYRHGHFTGAGAGGWNPTPFTVGSKTIQEAVGDWYYDRAFVREIDTLNLFPVNCTKTA